MNPSVDQNLRQTVPAIVLLDSSNSSSNKLSLTRRSTNNHTRVPCEIMENQTNDGGSHFITAKHDLSGAKTAPLKASKRRKLDDDSGSQAAAAARKVHFHSPLLFHDENDGVVPSQRDVLPQEIRTYERATKEEAKSAWWSIDETMHIQKRERSMVMVLITYCDSYVEKLEHLQTIAADDADADDQEQDDASKNDDDDATHIWLSNSPCRGLEAEVSYCHRNQRSSTEVVKTVLKIQEQMSEIVQEGQLGNVGELQREILREQYHILAAPSTKLAQLLALGDANVACQDECTADETSSSRVGFA